MTCCLALSLPPLRRIDMNVLMLVAMVGALGGADVVEALGVLVLVHGAERVRSACLANVRKLMDESGGLLAPQVRGMVGKRRGPL